MTKRGERVAPPPRSGGWSLRYASAGAAEEWEIVSRELASAVRRAYDQLESDPRLRTERQHPLRGQDSTTTVAGRTLEQWQYELSGSARLLYAIDDDRRDVWILGASVGHPKRTERVSGRRR